MVVHVESGYFQVVPNVALRIDHSTENTDQLLKLKYKLKYRSIAQKENELPPSKLKRWSRLLSFNKPTAGIY
jgi:hypothetical protein